jgi:ABC-type transport system involved in multi-copper enzyme maturation permease subunit
MISTLYSEELRATMRGHFAWLGAGVVLLALGGVAAAATQDTWVDGYGIIAYFLVPLAFLPLAAGVIAAPRANRFVESLFTAPVERRDWFIAKVLVLLTLGAAYYVALLPILAVYLAHVPMPLLLRKLLMWAPGLLVASIAIGTLIGVLFIGRSIAAPAATGMGILLAYAALVPLQELMVARGNGATRIGALTLLSPAVLLKNALGFTLRPACSATRTATSVGLSRWRSPPRRGLPLHLQGVKRGRRTRQRWIVTARSPLCIVPIGIADITMRHAPHTVRRSRVYSPAATVLAGWTRAVRCRLVPGHDAQSTHHRDGADTKQDLLILLPVEKNRKLTQFSLKLDPQAGLTATADGAPAMPPLEEHTYDSDVGPVAADGHHVKTGWIARVPVTLHPTRPWDIGGNRYPMTIAVTYAAEGDAMPQTLTSRTAVNAQVATGMYEMAGAGSLLPIGCFAAAWRRWRRTR